MSARVTLIVTQGKQQGQQYVFDDRTTTLIGKEGDCHVCFPKDKTHHTISRHHCLLDVNPPDVRVRDLGSRNGAYVNGKLIGKRDKGLTREDVADTQFAEFDLKDGDEVRLGPTTFRVAVYVPVVCGDCGAEIAEEQKAKARQPSGDYRCLECLRPIFAMATAAPATFAPPGRRCASCGVVVSREAASRRTGEFLCDACHADPEQVVRRLLKLAKSGRKELLAIEGYTIDKELGRGGMGAVYLAKHAESGRRVALKAMLPQVAAGQRARELFLREAMLTQALQNRHVVRLFDVGCSQATFFFTLEYCAGGSLADRLARRGKPLAPEQATRPIIQAFSGLEYAHTAELPAVRLADGGTASARGLVHRDIKPNNIFLGKENGRVVAKMGDYGLAKAFDLTGLSGMSVTGATGGTSVFMPRQQVVDFKYAQPEVDVWATAATLYYALTHQYPRTFPKKKDPWQVVLRNDAVPIRRRLPSLPKKLAAVIDQALIDRPDIAIKTAAELHAELQRALK